MTKKIFLSLFFIVAGLYAANNWWSYFKAEESTGLKSTHISKTVAVPAGNKTSRPVKKKVKKSDSLNNNNEPEKRMPLEGSMSNFNPFSRKKKKINKITMAKKKSEVKKVKSDKRNNKIKVSESIKKATVEKNPWLSNYSVDMILIGNGRKLASINGETYQIGERISEIEVVAIEQNMVILEDLNKNRKVFELKTEGKP